MSKEEKRAWLQGAEDRLHNDSWAWRAYRANKARAGKDPMAAMYVKGWEGSGIGE